MLSETVGYKSGLALSAERLREIVDSLGLGGYWPENDDHWYRLRSEEYEELFANQPSLAIHLILMLGPALRCAFLAI